MKIVTLPVSDLHPADYNPRKDLAPGDKQYEKLARSIETFGYVEPIVWNRTTGNIVGGHQRLKVLVQNGYTEVQVVEVELNEQEERIYYGCALPEDLEKEVGDILSAAQAQITAIINKLSA